MTNHIEQIGVPVQAGIAKNCNKYVETVSGDYCYIFAQNNGENLIP